MKDVPRVHGRFYTLHGYNLWSFLYFTTRIRAHKRPVETWTRLDFIRFEVIGGYVSKETHGICCAAIRKEAFDRWELRLTSASWL